MAKVLFISPHLDDVILSCGSVICRDFSEKNGATVVTVFSEGNDSSNHDKRRKDDIKAIKLLGANYVHLGFIDAPYRDSSLNSFSSILFHHGKPEELELMQEITDALLNLISINEIECCYFPLGVGGHVDHNLLFYIGLSLIEQNVCKCLFYEDMPYNSVKNWVLIRLSQCLKQNVSKELKYLSLQAQQLPFVGNYFINNEDEKESESKYRNEFSLLSYRQISSGYILNKYESDFNAELKIAALKCYTTEIEILFNGLIERYLKNEVFYEITQFS